MPGAPVGEVLAQFFAHRDQQIGPPDEEILQMREGPPYTGMDAALQHVRETFVRIVHDRFALQFPHHETERQRVQIVAVNGVKGVRKPRHNILK